MKSQPFQTYGFIFARGGSKGIPNKNLSDLGGIPLIAHTIKFAIENKIAAKVIVSTDDEKIAKCALGYGAEVPFLRPAELATDAAPEWLAWQHAVHFCMQKKWHFDTFLCLPTTSPFRASEDIHKCLEKIHSDKNLDIVLTVKNASRHPEFNMLKKLPSHLYVRYTNSSQSFTRRQDAPTAYDLTTVAYATKPSYILDNDQMFAGNVGAVKIPECRALDIDTRYDLEVARALLEYRKKGKCSDATS